MPIIIGQTIEIQPWIMAWLRRCAGAVIDAPVRHAVGPKTRRRLRRPPLA
jgi:hypothetical protein